MTIGIPREIKNGETRVSLTPSGCRRLTALGASFCVENGAGIEAGFSDADYRDAGAHILASSTQIWKTADLILKVKEPVEAEYEHIREGQTLFTYLHLAAEPALREVLCRKGVLAIAYETVEDREGGLPLLKPMSQIAGRLAVQVGAYFLQSRNGGSGVLLGGIPGTAPGKVTIVGAGNSGAHACRMAIGMGAQVTMLDIDASKLDHLDTEYNGRIVTLISNPANLERAVAEADLVIGAVLVPAARAPVIVSRDMVSAMRRGSVVVDIAVDQGGCIETIRPTSHEKPTYDAEGIIHYAVPNMPALVSRTATIGLTQASEPFVAMLVRDGPSRALTDQPGLGKGVNIRDGRITHPALAKAFGAPPLTSTNAVSIVGETFNNDAIGHEQARLTNQSDGPAAPIRRCLSDAQFEKIVRFMHANMKHDYHVDDFANQFGHSSAHFSVLFKNRTGKSPYRYFKDLRLQKGRELILTGKFLLKRVAEAVGYTSADYFGEIFKKAFKESAHDLIVQARRNASAKSRP